MARIRIILGYTSSAPVQVVYAGLSGSEAEQAMKVCRTAQRFEIFEGPGRRKNNPAYNPAAQIEPAPYAASPTEIPADLKSLTKAELQRLLIDAVTTIELLRAPQESAIDTPDEVSIEPPAEVPSAE